MPIIGKLATPSPIVNHGVSSFEAAEELILLGQENAFVITDDQFIGIVSLEKLLEEYKTNDISSTNIDEFMEPLFFVNEYEQQSKAIELMLINNVEHIAVTNKTGDYVGIISLEQLKNDS